MKKLFFLTIMVVCVFGMARFAHKETRGFKLAHVRDNFHLEKKWEESTEFPEKLSKQPFTFFNRGFQSFVFLSEDGTTILKLLSNHYQSRINKLSLLPWKIKWKEEKIVSDLRKLTKNFRSYEIAYADLKEETGLLYIHLNPTDHLHKSVTLIDPLGISHQIDLDKTAFLVQKRATPVYERILQLKKEGKTLAAKQQISKLIHLMVTRAKKGIQDTDFLIRTNYGFIDEAPIHLDLGPFVKNPLSASPEVYKKEIMRAALRFDRWLSDNAPELSSHLHSELAKL